MATGAGSEFVEGWLVAQVLGEGAYGEVRLLIHSRTGESVALKTMRASPNEAGAAATREAALHRALRHPHVLRCMGERRHQDAHYMFLEYAQGGELFDRIEPDVGMSEGDARRYWRHLLSGVRYLHSRGVAHRDIKPENLLLDAQDNLKISDFGMATLFRHGGAERYLTRRCGTLPYAGPEVLSASETPYRAEPADLWSCGVVLLAMLAGELPWEQATPDIPRYASWCGGLARGRPWDKVTARALGLLRRLLAREPQKRLTLDELVRHTWTVEDNDAVDSKIGDRGWCSQPATVQDRTATQVPAISSSDMDDMISYSQPAAPDDLLLSTQTSPATQNTQNIMQRLVRRMTRVWVNVPEREALTALCEALRTRGYTWKMIHPTILTINCGERIGMRAWAVRAAGECGEARVLLEFRRSRGCGLEFKRIFLELRAALQHVAAPAPRDARLDLLAPPLQADEPMDQS